MNNNVIIATCIMELAKNGWDAIVGMYKQSTPEKRKAILKI